MRPTLLLLVLALLLPAAAQAAPGVRTAQFGMDVTAGAVGARAASGGFLTRPLRAPRRYDLVGATWRRGSGALWLRGRRAGGRWSGWVRLSESEEKSRAAGHSTEPVWAGGKDFVQLRGARPLSGLHLSFVNAHVPAARASAVRKAQVALPTGGQLAVTPRAAWGASRCKPRKTAGYGRVDLAFVHHTETLNGYSRSESPSVVLGVCLFHRNVNRWDDIGYDFLVDRYGQVFEGRAGGIEEPVIGAQAGGFNSFSTGIAAIGDFRFSRFSSAGINSLARLLAWKLSLNGIPAVGTVLEKSGGGIFTAYPKGAPVTLNRISGHRDADQTACPGNALYRQLPALRQQVAQLEGPVSRLDLTAPQPRLVYPQPLVFSGRLTPAPGVALPAGAAVQIIDNLAKGGRVLATLPLAPDGSFSGALPLARNDVLQAVFAGGPGVPKLVSGVVVAGVAPALTLQSSATSVTRGSTITLAGSVSPAKGRLTIDEEELRGTRYRRVRTVKVRASGGQFSVTLGLSRPGTFRFTARTAASRQTQAGASVPVSVQVG
ncbi:MAG TPA: N-acetylmuramoyl-L-alanine amidase [Thermoleophilaceae bacterium]